jgi:hypothetical protein
MFCVVIVLSVPALYGDSAEPIFLCGNSAERTCFVWC